MDKDYVLQVAETIKDQLVALTPMDVICSWGVEWFVAVEYEGMPALRFNVSGRLFKGNVIIAYNESDFYGVFLQDYSGVKCVADEVFFDGLGDVIDKAVEQGPDKDEYMRFLMKEIFPGNAG